MRKPHGSTENGKIMHRAQGQGVEPITICLAPALREALDARAGRCGETRSAYLRRLIEADLRESGGVE